MIDHISVSAPLVVQVKGLCVPLSVPLGTYNKCILCGNEESSEHDLQFCTGINDQRAALMTSVNSYLNWDNFDSFRMKYRWLFVLMDSGYDITEWDLVVDIVAQGNSWHNDHKAWSYRQIISYTSFM